VTLSLTTSALLAERLAPESPAIITPPRKVGRPTRFYDPSRAAVRSIATRQVDIVNHRGCAIHAPES
jgi:hypothetical protein